MKWNQFKLLSTKEQRDYLLKMTDEEVNRAPVGIERLHVGLTKKAPQCVTLFGNAEMTEIFWNIYNFKDNENK